MTIALSNSFDVRIASSAFPAWRAPMLSRTWKFVGAPMHYVDPGLNRDYNKNYLTYGYNDSWLTQFSGTGSFAYIRTESGAAWDEARQILHIHGGGHGSYAGNEVISIDLSDDDPQWILRRPPTGSYPDTNGFAFPIRGAAVGPLNDVKESTGVYFDGRPRSVHTYNSMFVDADGHIYRLGGLAQYVSGSPIGDKPFRFNTQINDWDWSRPQTAFPNANSAYDTCFYGSSAWDDSRKRIWHTAYNRDRPYLFDPATLSSPWSVSTGQLVTPSLHHRLIYDERRDILIWNNDIWSSDYCRTGVGPYPPGIRMWRCDGSTPPAWINIEPTGVEPMSLSLAAWYLNRPLTTPLPTYNEYWQFWGYRGFARDRAADRYYFYEGSENIYMLTPPPANQDPFTNTWHWSLLSPSEQNTQLLYSPLGTGPDNNGIIWPLSHETQVLGRFGFSEKYRVCFVQAGSLQSNGYAGSMQPLAVFTVD